MPRRRCRCRDRQASVPEGRREADARERREGRQVPFDLLGDVGRVTGKGWVIQSGSVAGVFDAFASRPALERTNHRNDRCERLIATKAGNL
jgi:hypothetical protein